MKILAFSDLHCDRDQARRLVEMSDHADVVVAAGDFARIHLGLGRTLAILPSWNICTRPPWIEPSCPNASERCQWPHSPGSKLG